jgi:23S rRNA (uracil1939-C5)-methyltransferase
MRAQATARVSITAIAAGGDGVGRADGLAVFVPRTAPGDVIDARLAPRGRFARGELMRLVDASAARVAPRCPHYDGDRCGGCQLQHLAYEAQLDAKRRIVRDAFVRIARRDVPLPPITASPAPWEYRARLTLALRWHAGAWTFGLHRYDDPARIFQLRVCPITHPDVVRGWTGIHAAAAHLPRERELRGAVRLVGDELAFLLEGGARWEREARRAFLEACPSLAFVRWQPAGGAPRLIADRRRGRTPAASFEQVNPAVAALLRDAVVQRALAAAPVRAIDAYAGHGATARRLAETGVEVTAIEVDREAASHAAATLPPPSRVLAARVEDAIEATLPADVVVLNPPRAGVDPRVTDALARAPRPRRVLYVSCDPATLARDVGRLRAYQVTALEAFDMFPQTAHVETLCELTPEDA